MSGSLNSASATTALMTATRADVAIATQRANVSSIDVKKAEETAKEFEAVFISEMIKPMFEGISTDGDFGGGKGEEVFRGMMLEEYGKMVAQGGGIGLSDQVKEHMILMQQQADNGTQNAQ